jgi:hypothetical protein
MPITSKLASLTCGWIFRRFSQLILLHLVKPGGSYVKQINTLLLLAGENIQRWLQFRFQASLRVYLAGLRWPIHIIQNQYNQF